MSSISGLSPPILTLLLVGAGVLLGYGAYLATGESPEVILGGDVEFASKGEAFDVRDHLAEGKYTIFDFYADWCASCRVLDPQLRRLAADRDDVAVRKVDIVDWTSAVVKQYQVTSLPHVQVYDPNGQLVAEGPTAFQAIADIFGVSVF
jgi:thiol-disulfide isomerase/thioredoxin